LVTSGAETLSTSPELSKTQAPVPSALLETPMRDKNRMLFPSPAHQASLLVALLVVWLAPARAHAEPDDTVVRAFFTKHCYECHGQDAEDGRLRLDQLPAEFSSKQQVEGWTAVLDKLQSGAMPPKKKPQPPQAERKQVQDWVRAGLVAADQARQRSEGRVVLRRLNRAEYENTVRDLLGIDTDLKELLPEDDSAGGFDNNADALRLSPILMERYLETADLALDAAIAHDPKKPDTAHFKYSYVDDDIFKNMTSNVLKKSDCVVFFLGSDALPSGIRKFRAPVAGMYRIRISAFAYQSDKPVGMRVYGGDVAGRDGKVHLIGNYDVPPGKPMVVEIIDRWAPGDSVRPMPNLFSQLVYRANGAANYKGPGLAIESIEIEGPLIDQWPPESHRRLFGALPFAPAKADPRKGAARGPKAGPSYVVSSNSPAQDAERILRAFMPRAFRRKVAEGEAAPYIALVKGRLDEGYGFEEAVRVGLKAVLCSPEFLFLREKPGPLDGYALASRLSYFFWSSMPDQELLDLAEQGTLNQPDVLRKQVERLLNDRKARRFTEDFVGQWLDLRQIDSTIPDKTLYPEFDEALKVASVKETELFFEQVLKNDLSLINFVDSDFSMLNERLARHYRIPGVTGQEFRKVTLPPGSGRGGVLTQASVLKVTANGTTTSPVVRGAWVLKNILGQPAPPPPPNVPAIEPDLRGSVTIREQLAKHRQVASCASCHRLIDPPGFALEGFDAIGGRRDHYRSLGSGRRVEVLVNEMRVRYLQGPAVDESGELADGRKFANFSEFKKLLLQDKDQIARCLAEKLIAYSTGGGIRLADRPVVDDIVAHSRSNNYAFRSLIHEVVQSRIFLNK
jgi:mono/diheme cytochrome c family protein